MLKKIKWTLYQGLKLIGFEPKTLINSIKGLSFYLKDRRALKKQKGKSIEFPFGRNWPILQDRFVEAGTMSGHYFHQDLYIARKIFSANPKLHVDIGSRIDGFVTHVASFRDIEIMDIRFQKSNVRGITFKQADLMKLPAGMENYCDSLSALHSIEHFGLGRYGDPIDYNGHKKAIETIHKILKPGGTFYFSVPVGKQRIEFNAHRIFDIHYLLNLFKDKFEVNNFSYVNDAGDFFEDVNLEQEAVSKNFGCTFGCGIFELTKT